jgi:hypothetical protein
MILIKPQHAARPSRAALFHVAFALLYFALRGILCNLPRRSLGALVGRGFTVTVFVTEGQELPAVLAGWASSSAEQGGSQPPPPPSPPPLSPAAAIPLVS